MIHKGYVYLMKFDDSHYKIGMSKDVNGRLKAISKKKNAELLHVIETDNMTRLEKYFHSFFSSKSIAYEIFNLSLEDIAEFRKQTKVIYDPENYKTEEEIKVTKEARWDEIHKTMKEQLQKGARVLDELTKLEANFLRTKFPCISQEEAESLAGYYMIEFYNKYLSSFGYAETNDILPLINDRDEDYFLALDVLEGKLK